MPLDDAAKIWSLNYRLLLSVIASVEADISALGLDSKELFLLAEIDEHPYPAELATTMCMPKATVTVYLKRLEAAGFVRREIDPADLRRHRLLLTTAGRRANTAGLALLSEAFDGRLRRLTTAQRKEFKTLLERIV
ncbi:MAG: MarR family transcriptional regulator, temperature-dependent positive regulator of motility [Mycobacterium sp.]|jgi:DNA-binding MarR family transcriptional regulator|nr:MarR family transcriptional regulator, temperature-dependent positive regulator of motility [Mycobacterium sp.]